MQDILLTEFWYKFAAGTVASRTIVAVIKSIVCLLSFWVVVVTVLIASIVFRARLEAGQDRVATGVFGAGPVAILTNIEGPFLAGCALLLKITTTHIWGNITGILARVASKAGGKIFKRLPCFGRGIAPRFFPTNLGIGMIQASSVSKALAVVHTSLGLLTILEL